MRSSWPLLLALSSLVFLAGCGDQRMNIKGRVLKNGTAFTVPEDDFVRVTFVPVSEDGKNPLTCYIADYDNKAGTFKALGPDLAGIPKGKYRITVEHERKKTDLFKGAYDLKNSPFVFDINSNNQQLVLDLSKPPAR
jgi:hypothetical protein